MKFECLCGAVAFEIAEAIPNFYQCHCSLCRKQSGTASNAATFVKLDNLNWVQGRDNIRSYKIDSGFRSDFCNTCGCPVPNQLRGLSYYWVPAGLLEGVKERKVVLHLHCGSKADWDNIPADSLHFSTMPDFDTIYEILNKNVKHEG